MRPFPAAKHDPLVFDPALQQSLEAAMLSTPDPPNGAPIMIVSINPDGSRSYGGRLEYDECYSASLLKVAAMYAAFELRKACNDELAATGMTAAGPFSLFHSTFDPIIRSNRLPRLAGLGDLHLLPKYDQIFAYDPGTNLVNFSRALWNDVFGAIANGDNASAGRCIQRLGFGYITTALSEANFLDADSDRGIWLCGDFGFGFPPVRIPCSNDTPTAQGATAYHMAKLFTLLLDNQLVDPGSDATMLGLLQQAAVNLHLFLNRDTTVQYVTTHTKIGLGPVNSGFNVASEALIVQENSTGRQFVVVFQNQPRVNDASVFPVSRVVDTAIASFLFP